MSSAEEKDLPDMLFSPQGIVRPGRGTSYVPNSVFALEPMLEELGSPTAGSFPVGITLSPMSATGKSSRGIQQVPEVQAATTETGSGEIQGIDVAAGESGDDESASEDSGSEEAGSEGTESVEAESETGAREPLKPVAADSFTQPPIDSKLPSFRHDLRDEPASAHSDPIDDDIAPVTPVPEVKSNPWQPSAAEWTTQPARAQAGQAEVAYASAKAELIAARQKEWELFAMSDTTRRLDEMMAAKWPNSRARNDRLELDILSERLERELERHPAAFRFDEEKFAASVSELKETVLEARATVSKLNTAVADEQLTSQQLRAEIHRLEEHIAQIRAERDLGPLRENLQLSQQLVDFAADRVERESFLEAHKNPAPQQYSLQQFVVALQAERFEDSPPPAVAPVCVSPDCLGHRGRFSGERIRERANSSRSGSKSEYCNCERETRGDFQQRLRTEQERQWRKIMETRLGPPRPFPFSPSTS